MRTGGKGWAGARRGTERLKALPSEQKQKNNAEQFEGKMMSSKGWGKGRDWNTGRMDAEMMGTKHSCTEGRIPCVLWHSGWVAVADS